MKNENTNSQELAAIVAARNINNVEVQLFWYDNRLLIYPPKEEVLKLLQFPEKQRVCDKSTRFVPRMVVKVKKAFSIVKSHGESICVTFQGFLMSVALNLIHSGTTFDIKDLRICSAAAGTFPEPRYDLMHGFRFSQEELLSTMLKQDCSGLLEAPTRYGKTTLMVNTLRAFPTLPAVVTAPGVDLIEQLYDDITGERGIHDREVRLIGGGKNQKPTYTGINIVSMDSLHKLGAGAIRLLLCDEPHAAPATSRLHQIDQFPFARRYGFGATLAGRSDGKDLLIQGLFGHVLSRRTYLEAVAEGAICPLHIIFLEVEVTPRGFRTRDDAYDELLFDSHEVALTVADICHDVIPPDQQTLIFIKHEKQAELFMDKIGRDTSLAMAKKMTKTERSELTQLLRENVITRCLCTRIFVQGVTFPDVRVLINAEAGGNTTSAIQKPGRLAQIRPGKKCGIVIDLNFVPQEGFKLKDYKGEPWTAPVTDSKARRKAYENKGYEIHDVKNVKELKKVFYSLQ